MIEEEAERWENKQTSSEIPSVKILCYIIAFGDDGNDMEQDGAKFFRNKRRRGNWIDVNEREKIGCEWSEFNEADILSLLREITVPPFVFLSLLFS